jgi:hypothetical protein
VTHDHARVDLSTQNAVLAIMRAVLNNDSEQAAIASLRVPCVPCLILATAHFGLAMAAQLAGETLMTDELRRRYLAAIAEAEAELRAAGN